MSVPKSNVLSCSRSFLAKTDLGYCSPKQSQNVNVVVSPQMCHYDATPKAQPENEVPYFTYDANPETKSLKEELRLNEVPKVKERSIDTANETLKNMESIIKNKDLLIQVLVLCVDILENNPLIINKFVIAEEKELSLMIKYLTDADEVDIYKVDHECKCTIGKSEKYDIVDRIIVKKNGEIYNLKYSFPDVVQFLFERRFSTKFVMIK